MVEVQIAIQTECLQTDIEIITHRIESLIPLLKETFGTNNGNIQTEEIHGRNPDGAV